MAGLYCQYSFEWKMNNVRIMMQGQGNIYELDGPNYFDKIVGNSM